jgi:hypothetical protein
VQQFLEASLSRLAAPGMPNNSAASGPIIFLQNAALFLLLVSALILPLLWEFKVAEEKSLE